MAGRCTSELFRISQILFNAFSGLRLKSSSPHQSLSISLSSWSSQLTFWSFVLLAWFPPTVEPKARDMSFMCWDVMLPFWVSSIKMFQASLPSLSFTHSSFFPILFEKKLRLFNCPYCCYRSRRQAATLSVISSSIDYFAKVNSQIFGNLPNHGNMVFLFCGMLFSIHLIGKMLKSTLQSVCF